jgi:hypothetical protein
MAKVMNVLFPPLYWGRRGQRTASNLHQRLWCYKAETLRLVHQDAVPFGGKKKVSGTIV